MNSFISNNILIHDDVLVIHIAKKHLKLKNYNLEKRRNNDFDSFIEHQKKNTDSKYFKTGKYYEETYKNMMFKDTRKPAYFFNAEFKTRSDILKEGFKPVYPAFYTLNDNCIVWDEKNSHIKIVLTNLWSNSQPRKKILLNEVYKLYKSGLIEYLPNKGGGNDSEFSSINTDFNFERKVKKALRERLNKYAIVNKYEFNLFINDTLLGAQFLNELKQSKGIEKIYHDDNENSTIYFKGFNDSKSVHVKSYYCFKREKQKVEISLRKNWIEGEKTKRENFKRIKYWETPLDILKFTASTFKKELKEVFERAPETVRELQLIYNKPNKKDLYELLVSPDLTLTNFRAKPLLYSDIEGKEK